MYTKQRIDIWRKLTPFGFWTYELAYILERHSWKLDSHAFKESKQTKLDSKAPFCDQTWVPKQVKMFRSHYHHQNMVHYFMNLNKVLWNILYSEYFNLLYGFWWPFYPALHTLLLEGNKILQRICRQYGNTEGTRGWLGIKKCNFACGIHPATQSAIGQQQWVTALECCRMVDSVPIRHTISIL